MKSTARPSLGLSVSLASLVLSLTAPAWAMVVSPSATEVSSLPQTQCAALIGDLQGLRHAQRSLLQSLTQKNDVTAETLEILAAQEGKSLSKDLKRSAKALRANGERETLLAERLAKATDQLLTKVEDCLGRHSRAE